MNYYQKLDISEKASASDIKSAYRRLSLLYHPDRPDGNAEKFKEISEAYETLSDPERRQMYDMRHNNPLMGHQGAIPSEADIMNMLFGMTGAMPYGLGSMGGMGGISRMGPMPGLHIFRNGVPVSMSALNRPPPIIKTVTITLEQAFTGLNCPLEIERWVQQPNMKHTEKEKIYIEIPEGIDSKEIIVVRNKGNVLGDNNKGDIKIFIEIAHNKNFGRRGLDLILKKKISLKEALVGFKFDIHHINGKVYTINNRAGRIIEPNFERVIAGMGMKRGKNKGNFIIHFGVAFPKNLSDVQRQALKEIL